MPKQKIEILIPIVMEVMETQKKDFTKETKGHIASYGPSVLMAGLKQTVLFNEKNNAYINAMIFKIMQKQGLYQNQNNLVDLVNTPNIKIKQHVLDVVVACKLVLPTFKLPIKDEKKEE